MPARPKKNRKYEKQAKKAVGSFRIIGGEHRSRRLSFPESEGLRPTTDRVRETVFNWIGPNISGARVLDLFAGSGSLGFEAASRGANRVVCVEQDRLVVTALQDNATLLGMKPTQFEIVHADAIRYLDQLDEQFDLLLLDPPFRTALLQNVLDSLQSIDIIAPGAHIYVEHEAELSLLRIPSTWHELKSKTAGQVSYRYYSAD